MDNYFVNANRKKNRIEESNEARTALHETYDWLEAVVVSIVTVVLLFTFIFRIVDIRGASMENTLHGGDKVVIANLAFEPQYGDIVVVSRNYLNKSNEYYSPSEPIIKRVIATEGQLVDIDFDKGIVYVDGVALDEPYAKTPTTQPEGTEFPLRISDGKIFVLGDNREESLDSRSPQIGLIDERYVLGKAVARIFPFDKIGGLSK